MPNCFQLTRVGDGYPANLHDVDRAICHHFEWVCSDDKWAKGWYNTIGFMLALGKSFSEIIDYYQPCPNPMGYQVACFLAANYTSDAWYEHGWRK